MPDQPSPTNKHRSVRFEQDEWEVSDKLARGLGTNRAQILNQFLRWYLRKPGAKLPARPSAEAIAEAYEEWQGGQAEKTATSESDSQAS
ncbi:hypothetical protein ACFHW2_11585 [Actinomadura sp. LOL_016]|uniref:hypothetical protein n=1 Tax=unclassified Actinomadura TaxID=2626254 RepID=UPI003A80C28A